MEIKFTNKWWDQTSDTYNDMFAESMETRVYDASQCIYKTTIGHTTLNVDCSVDETRYDGNLLNSEEGWILITNDDDRLRPWRVNPIDSYSGATANVGYSDGCGGTLSSVSTQTV